MNSRHHFSQLAYEKARKSAQHLRTKNDSGGIQENNSNYAITNCANSQDALPDVKPSQKRYSPASRSARYMHQTTTGNISSQFCDTTNRNLFQNMFSQLENRLSPQIAPFCRSYRGRNGGVNRSKNLNTWLTQKFQPMANIRTDCGLTETSMLLSEQD